MKVCEKVRKKGVTSYNEVADELVAEFTSATAFQNTLAEQYDQKNIRRRVYDALNVLMAMNIISKEKKEIKWLGLPSNSVQECFQLEKEKQKRIQRIREKRKQLYELIMNQISFKNLVQRNKEMERENGPPTQNSYIQLPFIVVHTNKKTVIDCSISHDKYVSMNILPRCPHFLNLHKKFIKRLIAICLFLILGKSICFILTTNSRYRTI